MQKLIIIYGTEVLVILILLLIIVKSKILIKIKNKIVDYFNVRKYKKKANTAINSYHSRNNDYITALETVQTLVVQNMEFQKQIEKLKQERKELKKEIEESTKKGGKNK